MHLSAQILKAPSERSGMGQSNGVQVKYGAPVIAFPHLGEDVLAILLTSIAYCLEKNLALCPGKVVGVNSPTHSFILLCPWT